MKKGVLTFMNAVEAIGVDHLREEFIVGNKRVRQLFEAQKVHIIIACPVNEEESFFSPENK